MASSETLKCVYKKTEADAGDEDYYRQWTKDLDRREIKRLIKTRQHFKRAPEKAEMMTNLHKARQDWLTAAIEICKNENKPPMQALTNPAFRIKCLRKSKSVLENVLEQQYTTVSKGTKLLRTERDPIHALDYECDITASKMTFQKSVAPGNAANADCKKIPMHDILRKEKKDKQIFFRRLSEEDRACTIQYLHVPANHMDWVEVSLSICLIPPTFINLIVIAESIFRRSLPNTMTKKEIQRHEKQKRCSPKRSLLASWVVGKISLVTMYGAANNMEVIEMLFMLDI